jgi:hypothetical protein
MPDDGREWTLECKPKRSGLKQEAMPEERYITCTNCFAVIAGDVQTCPYCGKEIEKKQRKAIEQETETELVQIKGFIVNTKTPNECRSYAELLEYARMMGYKKGWAFYQAKQRGLLHGT